MHRNVNPERWQKSTGKGQPRTVNIYGIIEPKRWCASCSNSFASLNSLSELFASSLPECFCVFPGLKKLVARARKPVAPRTDSSVAPSIVCCWAPARSAKAQPGLPPRYLEACRLAEEGKYEDSRRVLRQAQRSQLPGPTRGCVAWSATIWRCWRRSKGNLKTRAQAGARPSSSIPIACWRGSIGTSSRRKTSLPRPKTISAS